MELFIIFTIGFISSFFGSFTSGGTSLLSLALLGAYGIPTLMSLGIYKVGNVGFQLGGLLNYLRADKVQWRYVLPLVLIGIIGAYVGGNIVLSIDEQLLSRIIGFGLFLFIPLSLFKPKLGTVEIKVSKTKQSLGYIAYFFTSVWGASFTIGAGLFNMVSQTYFFGMTLLQVKGTAKIPGLVKSLVVLLLFVQAGIINWQLSVVFLIGMFTGSLIGTHFTIKIGDNWLRYILMFTVLLLSIKLIFAL